MPLKLVGEPKMTHDHYRIIFDPNYPFSSDFDQWFTTVGLKSFIDTDQIIPLMKSGVIGEFSTWVIPRPYREVLRHTTYDDKIFFLRSRCEGYGLISVYVDVHTCELTYQMQTRPCVSQDAHMKCYFDVKERWNDPFNEPAPIDSNDQHFLKTTIHKIITTKQEQIEASRNYNLLELTGEPLVNQTRMDFEVVMNEFNEQEQTDGVEKINNWFQTRFTTPLDDIRSIVNSVLNSKPGSPLHLEVWKPHEEIIEKTFTLGLSKIQLVKNRFNTSPITPTNPSSPNTTNDDPASKIVVSIQVIDYSASVSFKEPWRSFPRLRPRPRYGMLPPPKRTFVMMQGQRAINKADINWLDGIVRGAIHKECGLSC